MGFTLTVAPKKRIKTPRTPRQKTASGDFFQTPNDSRFGNRPQPLRTQQGTTPYSYKIVSGRPVWPSRDPIEERGGVNLYGYARNNGNDFYDYLGLVGKRTCIFTILGGHGWFPEGENNTAHPDPNKPDAHRGGNSGGTNRTAMSYINHSGRRQNCGDRVGVVSCFSGDVNDFLNENFPDQSIPNVGGNHHDPTVPLYVEDDEGDIDYNDSQPGYLTQGDALDQLRDALIAAQNAATAECNREPTCCKKITVVAKCTDGGRPYFSRFAARTKRGRKLCKYSNTYDCKTGTWGGNRIAGAD